MKDKKNIVLLIIAIIILCIAIVFAVWSFRFDQAIAKKEQFNINGNANSILEIENKNEY